MEPERIKHLEFIQNIITRMNTNSFQIKGWMITIVSALLAIYADKGNVLFIFVAVAPTLVFWFIDSYYLQQERRFRGLYNDVRISQTKILVFSMDIEKYKGGIYNFWNNFISITIWPLYGLIIAGLIIIGLLIKHGIIN